MRLSAPRRQRLGTSLLRERVLPVSAWLGAATRSGGLARSVLVRHAVDYIDPRVARRTEASSQTAFVTRRYPSAGASRGVFMAGGKNLIAG